MRALVLGGCGFIGSHIVDALVKDGHSVTVFSRTMEKLRKPPPNVEYIIGDFGDTMKLAEALTGKDAVFHLVTSAFPGTGNLDPKSDISNNLVRTIALIELMNSLGIKRIVYLSSGGTVYGKTSSPIVSESHNLSPINSYGIVKVAVESYLSMYRSSSGLKPVAVRASNPYGPRQGHSGMQGVVSTFLNKIKNSEEIEIWGDGSVVRDYIYAEDLARLCVDICKSEFCGVMNAGSGVGHSLLDVVRILSDVTGVEINPHFKPSRAVDVPYSVLDVSLAKKVIGWAPKVEFRNGVAQTWEWIEKNK